MHCLLATRQPSGDLFHDGSFHEDRPVFTYDRARAHRYPGAKSDQVKPSGSIIDGTILVRDDAGTISPIRA